MHEPSIPQYHRLLWPAVVALRDLGGSASISELDEQVISREGFSEEQQSVLHGDGPNTEINYRLAWARSYLKKMGLATNTDRGVWALTSEGRTVTQDQIEPLRQAWLKQNRDDRKKRQAAKADDEDTAEVEEMSWKDQLLERLLAMDPDAFERLCMQLLRRAGFIRTEVTGKSGDGGIDGVGVYRLSLVSFPVYFQAKRWRNSVGSSTVRDFRGAMSGRGEKGLLISTSTFTSEAKAEASRDGAPPVDLVNGTDLCELMKQYELGVKVTPRKVEYDITIDEEAIREI